MGADVDAIAAAAALSLFLSKKNSVRIGIPEHISLDAKNLAQKMGIKYEISPSLNWADVLILVDFNSAAMLGTMGQAVKSFSGSKYIIDHHDKSSDIVAVKNAWIEEQAVASCVLIYKLFKKFRAKISKQIATLIACGITADSAHFLIADASTFSIMAEMLKKSGKRFSEITELLRVERGFSEKIAMLKAAKRSRIFKLGSFIAVTADVGAFEADAATALIKVGADLAFAGNAEDGTVKISGRASQNILKETGLDLAKDIFQQLGNFFGGSGGGHKGAAAFNGKGDNAEAALLKCIELTHKRIAEGKTGIEFKEYT